MKSSLKTLVIVFVLSVSGYAQQDPNYTFYGFNMNIINPAFAGSTEGTNLTLGMRSQWAGVEGAPQSQSAIFAMPMGKKVGLGVSILNDQTFIENQTWFALDMSYYLNVTENHKLYFGIKASANSYDANTQGLITYGVGQDGTLLDFESRFTPNIGAGVLLKHNKYFISASLPKLLTPERLQQRDGNAFLSTDRTHAYLSGGYDFLLSKTMTLKAMSMLRYVDAAPLSYEITGILDFNRRLDLGLSYRISESISGMVLMNISNGFDIGYAYENAMAQPINGLANGTHELFMNLRL